MSRGKYNKSHNHEEDLLDFDGMESASGSDATSVDSGSEEERDTRAFHRDARVVGGHKIQLDDGEAPTRSVAANTGSQNKHSTTESKGGVGELSAEQKAKLRAQTQSTAPTRTLEDAKRAYQETNQQQAKAKSMFSFLNFSQKAAETTVKGSHAEKGRLVDDSDSDDHSDDSSHGMK